MTRNKYNARKTIVDGIMFDSKREAGRYLVLLSREQAGEIVGLHCHPRWDLTVNGVKIGRYTADFEYYKDGSRVVEDVKGVRTRDFVLRKKLMKAIHGIDVREVK